MPLAFTAGPRVCQESRTARTGCALLADSPYCSWFRYEMDMQICVVFSRPKLLFGLHSNPEVDKAGGEKRGGLVGAGEGKRVLQHQPAAVFSCTSRRHTSQVGGGGLLLRLLATTLVLTPPILDAFLPRQTTSRHSWQAELTVLKCSSKQRIKRAGSTVWRG